MVGKETEGGLATTESVIIPEALYPEIESLIEGFRVSREANRAAYLATSEEQFVTRVNEDPQEVADQRTYLISQIRHSYDRAKAFLGETLWPLPTKEELEKQPREDLIGFFGKTTEALMGVFSNPNNWGKKAEIPYAGELTGMTLIAKVYGHELKHVGMNETTLSHFGIPRSHTVVAPMGR